MPWKEARVSDERMRFIVGHEFEEESMAELCRQHGISRKTGYKWLARWEAEGPGGAMRPKPSAQEPSQRGALAAD